jgi:excisionase family DNA binding protein
MSNAEMLHVNDAAARLGVSPYTVRAWLRQRRIAHVRCGRRVLVPASAVERFIAANTVEPRESGR